METTHKAIAQMKQEPAKAQRDHRHIAPSYGVSILKTWMSRREWLLKPVLHR